MLRCSLPPVGIKPVARADKASTTFLLSAYLDSMAVGWTLGVSKYVNWPGCVHRVRGVTDLLAYLNTTEYATGCVSWSAHPQLSPSDCMLVSALAAL